MKENIYTIPVLDAFRENCECPFCYMKKVLEDNAIEFVMGPSYMEVDVRGETNKLGFCKEHLDRLYSEQNRLGLALMLHTHLINVRENLEGYFKNGNNPMKKSGLLSILNKSADSNSNDPFSRYVNRLKNSCYICNRINDTFDRYIDTFFLLWRKDAEIKDLVSNSKGMCIEHFYLIYRYATKKLSSKLLNEFYDIITPIFLNNLKRVEDDLEWFIFKYDHRHKDKPWKNSKDAIPRTILKLSSNFIE